MMCSMDPINNRGIRNGHIGHTLLCAKTNKHTQYTVRRQTNIHNTQYEDKQTYTIHSTKTNKHTQYSTKTNKYTQHTVRRQTNIHNTQYEDKQTYTIHSTKKNTHTQHRWPTLNITTPRGMKNGNPLGINQTVRRQTKRKYTTQNRKLKS